MSRLRALNLDFNATRPPPSRWGLAVLCLGLIAAAAMTLDYLGNSDELAAWQQQAETLKHKLARRQPPAETPAQQAAARQALRVAAGAAQEFNLPWDLLLLELEAAVDERVALLSVDPDVAKRQLRITGEARQLSDALAFVGRLEGTALVQKPVLSGHESRPSDGVPVVVFTILAGWDNR